MPAAADTPSQVITDEPAAEGWRAELGMDPQSLRRLLAGLVILLAGSAGAGWVLRAPLTAAADWFVRELGVWGLFGGILFTDSWVAPPLTHEPLLLFAHAGGISFVTIWAYASTASVLAGPIGYALGALLGRVPAVDRRLRGSGVERVMKRRGATVVAAAAITPIPFAFSTWLAGANGVPFLSFIAACLVRIIKVALYLFLITLGWGQPAL